MNVKMIALLAALFFLAGCAAPGGFPPNTAMETQKVPADKRIEVSLAPVTFGVAEVEFHVQPGDIPMGILRTAKELVPDGEVHDCEIEYHADGKKYYEVTFVADGMEHEVMFTEEGVAHRWEVEIAKKEVPTLVMKKAEKALPDAKLNKAEQILDGTKKPIEFHFKMEKDGRKYKVTIPLDPKVAVMVYRETIAEIEVPK